MTIAVNAIDKIVNIAGDLRLTIDGGLADEPAETIVSVHDFFIIRRFSSEQHIFMLLHITKNVERKLNNVIARQNHQRLSEKSLIKQFVKQGKKRSCHDYKRQ